LDEQATQSDPTPTFFEGAGRYKKG